MKTILQFLFVYLAEVTLARHFLFVPQPVLYSHTRFHYDLARQMVEKGYKVKIFLLKVHLSHSVFEFCVMSS